MIEKKFINEDLEIELTSFIDDKQNVWFRGKEIAEILILSNDYDKISKNIHEYMKGVRVPCKYCIKQFLNKDTLKMHYKVIHRIEK